MTIIEIAKVTTKGQITIPNRIRKLLRLEEGSSIAFSIGKNGVMLTPCEVTAKSPYNSREWQQIEKMASEKGKTFSSNEAAKNHLASL